MGDVIGGIRHLFQSCEASNKHKSQIEKPQQFPNKEAFGAHVDISSFDRNCLPTGRKTAQLSPATLIQCESEPGRPVSPSVIKSVSHPISRGRGHQVLAWLLLLSGTL
ncbi:hypothetical protein CEXT_474771 [Caerostris extrusa]|uniref:Uncharacterized protein n=1 Tax=Caerostris extrusa TaxID=172846 RepID=A0AAV4TAB7_CAEEX|nr:hypothetical protein CEXT_474771 [Caerostris extrusa]